MGSWEHFPHGADIGIRGYGETAAQAFEQAGIAMSAIVTDPARIKDATRVPISVEAPDIEILLVRWLNAIIFEMATRSMVFSQFSVRINDAHLEGSASGEQVDIARHEPAVELKGATLTQLRVRELADHSWLAQCIVDV